MKHKFDKTSSQESSGNPFKDLGCPNPEELLKKAQIALEIFETIKSVQEIFPQFSYAMAAEKAGISSFDLEEILDGNLLAYSIELLSSSLGSLKKMDPEEEKSVFLYDSP